MKIFPAIDLLGGKAVRLYKGDYEKVTVYSDIPEEFAVKFYNDGARCLHVVDLDGARYGTTDNMSVIKRIKNNTGAFIEVGGGIRTMETIEKYLSIGVNRVILGTKAVTDRNFLCDAIKNFGESVAVGVDIKDKMVAIKGWTEKSDLEGVTFCKELENLGVRTIICTDISKDGAMKGTNFDLYSTLSEQTKLDIVASGGVSSISDVERLNKMGLYGAIIGKAYYMGAINIRDAIGVAR